MTTFSARGGIAVTNHAFQFVRILRRDGCGRWDRLRLLLLLLWCSASGLAAQTNSWINPVSGSWEVAANWSAGFPGTNQNIFVDNPGWKAVGISPTTVQTHPETLTVETITVSSPTNTMNTLLMNFAGLQNYLLIGGSQHLGKLIVASNSAVVMLSSALKVQNDYNPHTQEEQGAFSVGGTFNESEFSIVAGNFLRVGDIGPGVYCLTNSFVAVLAQFVGGSFPGLFVQQGGTNTAGAVQINAGGEYHLYEGQVAGDVYPVGGTFTLHSGVVNGDVEFHGGGTFSQEGGSMNGTISFATFGGGAYVLKGGLHIGTMNLPGSDQTQGTMVQTGGTNLGAMTLGYRGLLGNIGGGSYTLSNGILHSDITINGGGGYTQWGGSLVTGDLDVLGTQVSAESFVFANCSLGSGEISASSLTVQAANFNQSGGTNRIVRDAVIGPSMPGTRYVMSGGLLVSSNTTVLSSFNGGFFQSGGVHTTTNMSLSTVSSISPALYDLSGGQLIVSNVGVNGVFRHSGGTVALSGALTLNAGTWDERTGGQTFGPLILNSASGATSLLLLPAGACVIQFANSSSSTWSNAAGLTIENWSGSINGGGNQQIIFGNNASALTAGQVGQIQFHNPVGFAPGTYGARILASGEITPGPILDFQPGANGLVLRWEGSLMLQSATNVLGPYEDLSGTSPYTNSFTGPQRFFRLRQ